MSGDMTDQNRIIGRLEAQIDSAEERLDRIETKLDSLIENFAQARGGWKVIWGVAGAGGAMGAAFVKLLAMAKGAP